MKNSAAGDSGDLTGKRFACAVMVGLAGVAIVLSAAANQAAGILPPPGQLPGTGLTSRPENEAAPQPQNPLAATEAPYPGLPTLTLSPGATKTERADFDRLIAATRFAIAKGQWPAHRDALDKVLSAAAGLGEKTQAASNLERILSQRTPSLMLSQSAAIRALGVERLTRLCGQVEMTAFIEWLFTTPQALQPLVATVKPQDNLDQALDLWRGLWSEDIAGREEFINLALAVALVFDEPVPIRMAVYGVDPATLSPTAAARYPRQVDPYERYRFYRESAKRGAFKTDLSELAAYELVWVVDAPVPAGELAWALKKVDLSRKAWSRAYAMVRYRMDKAAGRENLYDKYTLEEILKEGGTCGDQAYFAAMTAKAHGIPAMVIAGSGERGGHAWFGYKASTKGWNLEAGRYTSDNFVAGTATDPQTRAVIMEHELKILADPQHRTKGWQTSERLVQLAASLTNDPALTQLALETAVKTTPRHFEGWRRLLEFRVTQRPAPADWQKEIQRARTPFKDYPDLIEKFNAIELDYLAASGSIDLAHKAANRQTRRLENKSEGRSDLILDSLDREVALADHAGETDKARRLYHRAMADTEGSIVKFTALAPRYFAWGKRNKLAAEVAHDISRRFDDIPVPGDLFGLQSYLSALNLMKAQLEEAGLASEARRLRKRASRLEDTLKAIRKTYANGGGN